jgi:metal transporter CNNM
MFPNGSVFSDMWAVTSPISALMASLPNLSSLPIGWLWAAIVLCIVQSAMFSGLNLAVFSLSQLRLQIDTDGGDADAARVLALRNNSNQVLSTIVWGNISTNVLLTLLSDSVLTGIAGFFFSAFALTILGEIIPQAYFSRNALRMVSRLLPFLNFYRVVLYPLAKPTALLLDIWLGIEGVNYMRERDVRALITRSAMSGGDISKIEATGAQNFLDLDDVPVCDEGEPIHAQSIISLPLANRRCILPPFTATPNDPFLRKLDASGMKWIVVTNPEGEPEFVLDSNHFLRDALLNQLEDNHGYYWHKPLIVRDTKTRLGDIIGQMKVMPERPDDDVIDHDIIIVWAEQKRIITGSDLLGRLLRGIATVVPPHPSSAPSDPTKATARPAAMPAANQTGLA